MSAGVIEILDDNPVVGARRTGPARFWTTRELRVFRETYVAGGLAACLEALPGRTASALYNRAGLMGLHRPRVAEFRKRWTANPALDEIIRRVYAKAPTRGAIIALARSLGRPRWWVSKRAAALGCVAPRFKQPDWTDAEDEVLIAAPALHLRTLQKRLARIGSRRSETAIKVRLKRIGASRRDDPDRLSALGVATLMGVDGKTVTLWLAKGWLKAKRRGTERTVQQGGDQWVIKPADVRRFVIDHAAHVDLRKVDKFWFIDLMAHAGGYEMRGPSGAARSLPSREGCDSPPPLHAREAA